MSLSLKSFKLFPFFGLIFVKCWRLFVYCVLFFVFIYLFLGAFSATLILAFGILYLFYKTQDYLLFHPDDNNYQSRMFVQAPSDVDLPFQNLFIQSLDGTMIHLYFIRHPEPKGSNAPTLVYFHGNAGNMGHRLQNAAGLYTNLQCNILMVEYRGYGLSKGQASEHGIYLDAQAVMDFLASRPDVNQNKIIIFGRSLGGAVAIDLASRPEFACRIWCLIVENTFTSIPDITIALFRYWWLRFIPIFAYKNKFLSKQKINGITLPTLFISGQSDSLVPPGMMLELHSLSCSPHKHLLQIPYGGHNDTWACSNYYSSLANFLNAAQSYKPSPPASSATAI